MKLLTIIPARAGSKRVVNKNIKILQGKPLIAWTILAALKAKIEMDIIVSTNSSQIAEIAQYWGAEVPFLRPETIAQDHSNVFDAISFTINQLKEAGRDYDHIMLLQPSSPLRTAADIYNAVSFFQQKKAKSVISVSPLATPLSWCMPLDMTQCLDNYIQKAEAHITKRSQDLPNYYHLNGAIYLAIIEELLAHKTFYLPTGGVYAFPMSIENGLDIDTPSDFERAAFYMSQARASHHESV